MCMLCMEGLYIRCGVRISCLYLPLKWVSHCPNTLLWSAYTHTPLERYTYTWYLVRSDGVKFGVSGFQRVNGQSNEVFDLRLCSIYQCWNYHFETYHKIMRNLKVSSNESYYIHTHI